MMKRLNRLPEYVEHLGYALRYVGSERLELKRDTWLRHTYVYLGGTAHECFFEIVGESGSLNLDGQATVISKEKAESLPLFLHSVGEKRRTPIGTRRARAILDNATASQRMRDVLEYLAGRRKKRDERQQAKADRKVQIDLSRRIRGQVKPFGGEG